MLAGWRLRRVAVFEATLRQINGLIARGRYADFVQVSLVTNVPIRDAETNGDLRSRVSCILPTAETERFRPRGHWCTFQWQRTCVSSDVSLSRALLSHASGGCLLALIANKGRHDHESPYSGLVLAMIGGVVIGATAINHPNAQSSSGFEKRKLQITTNGQKASSQKW